jgi:hypothetical protein
MLHWVPHYEYTLDIGDRASCTLNSNTRWTQVVNFTLGWLTPQIKPQVSTQYKAGKNPTTTPKFSTLYPSHYGDIHMSAQIT